jgi:hypothetical protein
LKGGCRALKAPVDTLESNWAYMVMTALAWDLCEVDLLRRLLFGVLGAA